MPDGVTANKAVEALGGMFNEYVSIDRVASQETIAVDAARRVLLTVTCQCAHPSDMHRWEVKPQMRAVLCQRAGAHAFTIHTLFCSVLTICLICLKFAWFQLAQ